MLNLNQFISKSQLSIIRSCIRGEEGEYFRDKIANLKNTIATMPKTYETEEIEDPHATLHYFSPSSDWWIIERDQEQDQLQAFGFACLNNDDWSAELGYINIAELIAHDVELDLYYSPRRISQIKEKVKGQWRDNIQSQFDI